MKIEEGKYYSTRGGELIGPMRPTGSGIFPFDGLNHSSEQFMRFRSDGKWQADGEESRNDLTREQGTMTKAAPPSLVVTRDGKPVEDQAQGIEDFKNACRRAAQPPALLDWSETAAPEYAPLAAILQEAYDQAASGKGRERHANDRPFIAQPILQIGRMCGPGFDTGQSIKKQQEAMGMLARGEDDAAIRELLGAINYAAAAVILIRERKRA